MTNEQLVIRIKAGENVALAGIYRLSLPEVGALLHWPNLGNFTPGYGHVAVGNGQPVHRVDGSVYNQHNDSSAGQRPASTKFPLD